MAQKAHERLADALEAASSCAIENILQGNSLASKQLTLLKKEGFLKPVIRGWYLLDADLATPDTGTSVLWQESYWGFVNQYLQEAAGNNYVLSAEQSLDLHTGANQLPDQLLVSNTQKINRVVQLPRGLSLSLFSATTIPVKPELFEGVRIFPLAEALVKVGPLYFRRQPDEIALALRNVDFRSLVSVLLEQANIAAASRLAGAFRAMDMLDKSDELIAVMDSAGLEIKEVNPFDQPISEIGKLRPQSPYAARIALLWHSMAQKITALVPAHNIEHFDLEKSLLQLEEAYTHDAYHSLSIEGYKVTADLIERVRSGGWNPDDAALDKKHLDAMAARGYWEAHNQVKMSIQKLHAGDIDHAKFAGELAGWYRALFSPMVRAGMLNAVDLAGFRNRPVFIRGSRHIPLPVNAVTDAMQTLFECAEQEEHPLVCAILCHWFVGYIHPFPDGNGRTARFLMNTILVANGYPWTIIRLETRAEYMEALEQLSTEQEPEAFVNLILEAMNHHW